jgi:prepilin-type N-terminal cleavage/methylation domain-containing protein
MQKRQLFRSRKGFTLVEVALAVAVGLIVIGGAIVGFNSVRENAQNSGARERIDAAVALIENMAAANNQLYPTSNAASHSGFGATWKAQRPDYNTNPWGGRNANAAGDGVTEWTAASFGGMTQAAPGLLTAVAATATDGAGNLIYRSATAAGPWGHVTDASDNADKVVRSYFVSLYDKAGTPFWYVKGGR